MVQLLLPKSLRIAFVLFLIKQSVRPFLFLGFFAELAVALFIYHFTFVHTVRKRSPYICNEMPDIFSLLFLLLFSLTRRYLVEPHKLYCASALILFSSACKTISIQRVRSGFGCCLARRITVGGKSNGHLKVVRAAEMFQMHFFH